ncbi:MAG: transposase [Anaerolineaceae bacterium]|nr:transposase [Anaerolineaceae bacterium]
MPKAFLVAVACDSHYGRSAWFRDQMSAASLEYYADVPADTKVYLQPPVIGIPQNKRGRKPISDVSSHHAPCARIACGTTLT